MKRIGKRGDMSLLLWFAMFAVSSLFWAWILFGGGAEHFADHPYQALVFLRWLPGHNISAEHVRLFALICWLVKLVWFILGLIYPDVRFLG